jgi:hypothetical protein
LFECSGRSSCRGTIESRASRETRISCAANNCEEQVACAGESCQVSCNAGACAAGVCCDAESCMVTGSEDWSCR